MLALVAAAACAVVYGVADYSGGVASRRVPALTVVVLSQLASIPLVLALLPVTTHGPPRPADLAWGAAAGLAGTAGLAMFYRALAAGAMTIVAPVTAVTSVSLPLVVGLMVDPRPAWLALGGVACAVAAAGLVSLATPEHAPDRAPTMSVPAMVVSGLVAGAGFGLFFALLDRAAADAGLWPLLAARLGTVTVAAVAVVTTATSLRVGSVAARWIVAAGVLDMTANALFLVAAQRGALSVVGPIASLYPVSTVVMAMVLDRERVRPVQLGGLLLAVAALVLVGAA